MNGPTDVFKHSLPGGLETRHALMIATRSGLRSPRRGRVRAKPPAGRNSGGSIASHPLAPSAGYRSPMRRECPLAGQVLSPVRPRSRGSPARPLRHARRSRPAPDHHPGDLSAAPCPLPPQPRHRRPANKPAAGSGNDVGPRHPAARYLPRERPLEPQNPCLLHPVTARLRRGPVRRAR